MTAKQRAEVVDAARRARAEGMNAQQIARAAAPARAPTEADAKLDAAIRKRVEQLAEEERRARARGKP